MIIYDATFSATKVNNKMSFFVSAFRRQIIFNVPMQNYFAEARSKALASGVFVLKLYSLQPMRLPQMETGRKREKNVKGGETTWTDEQFRLDVGGCNI